MNERVEMLIILVLFSTGKILKIFNTHSIIIDVFMLV